MSSGSLYDRIRAIGLILWALVGAAAPLSAQTAGTLDLGFDPNVSHVGATSPYYPGVSVIASQPDGKVIIGGSFNNVGGTACNGIARLNADGTVDGTFVLGLSARTNVRALALLRNGKILVVSTGPNANGQSATNLNRLNPDGSVDANFNVAVDSFAALAVQPDGKILVAAWRVTASGLVFSNYPIVRLHAAGTVDATFSSSSWGAVVKVIAVRPDGKILVAGSFGSFLGQQRNGIALLNADGSLDTTFNPGTQLWGTNYVSVAAMVPQPDGKILVAGLFPPAPTSGPLSSRILRLNGDGTSDGTFSPVTSSADNAFSLLALQADGKVLAAGVFPVVYGQPSARVARFNADGTIDSTATFDAGSGIGGSSSGSDPFAIGLQNDGRILIGGGFTTVNGQARNRMARFLNDPAIQTLTVVDDTRLRWLRGGAGPEVAGVVFELSTDGGANWITLGPGVRTLDGWELTAQGLLPASGIVRAAGALAGSGSSVSQTQAFSGLPVVTVSAAASPPTDGTVTGGGNKPAGSAVTLVATPSAGCDFVNWTEGATPVSTSETYTFTAGADRTLVANFTRRSYVVTSTASHAAGGATSGGGTFSHGIQVSLVAQSAVGYRFTDWTENGTPVSESPTMRFPAEGPRSLVANFTPATYAVNVLAKPPSEGTVSGSGVFTHGDTVRLVATPVPGHTFLHWSENGSPINRSTTLTFQASGNRSLVAAFAADLIPGGSYFGGPPTIGSSGGNIGVISTTIGLIYLHSGPLVTTSVSPANAGSVVGGGRVNSSASVTVLATPRAGRTFANWTENGVVVSNSASYTFTPAADRTLVANFTAGNNANLASLQSHQATLTPTFDPNVTTYYAKVPSGTDTFALAPILEQEGATIRINGASASADGYIPSVALNLGDNTIVVTVTAPDGVTSKTYTVMVTRGATLPGDINGDGSPDLILQNAAGQIAVWYTDASGMLFYSAYVYAGGLGDWKVAATVDLNRDGNADIICQNNAGQVFVWYTDTRGVPESFAYLSKGSLGDWKIAAAADMNGDGNPDLILQNGAGQIVVWHLNSTGNFASGFLLHGGALGDWRVVAAADSNGDGNADIMFQNGIGQIVVWHLNGNGAVASGAFLYSAGLGDWRIAAVMDMNRDAVPDIIFQNNFGQIFIWRMTANGQVASAGYLYGGGLGDWRVR